MFRFRTVAELFQLVGTLIVVPQPLEYTIVLLIAQYRYDSVRVKAQQVRKPSSFSRFTRIVVVVTGIDYQQLGSVCNEPSRLP